MTDRIAVVIPTLGTRPQWLADCLNSIKTQSVPCRIVVVGPSAADLRVCDDFDVDLVRHDVKGLASAVNRGWALATEAAYVSWLGDDDLLAPDSLARTSTYLDSHPEHSMVYGRVRYIDEDGRTRWMSRPTRFAGAYLRAGKNFLSQQGCLIRRSAASNAGWLDERLMNAMDQDLFTKIRAWGPRGYIPRELGAFRLHEGSITTIKGAADESELVRRRYARGGARAAYLSWRLVGHRVDWALDAAMRRLPVPPVPTCNGRPYTAPSRARARD